MKRYISTGKKGREKKETIREVRGDNWVKLSRGKGGEVERGFQREKVDEKREIIKIISFSKFEIVRD